LTLHLIVHPLVTVLRDKDGILQDVAPEGAPDAIRESFMHVEVDRVTDPADLPRWRRTSPACSTTCGSR
jgi:glutamate dehydrogenase